MATSTLGVPNPKTPNCTLDMKPETKPETKPEPNQTSLEEASKNKNIWNRP